MEKYPNLNMMIYKKGIKKKAIAECLGISTKALKNKMTGISKFTWQEVCIIQKTFFADESKEYLFTTCENAS